MEKINNKMQCCFSVLGAFSLFLMLLVTILDIMARLVGVSFPGAYEIIGWLSAMAIGCSLGYTQLYKGHVAIEFINNILPASSGAVVGFFVFILGFCISSLTAFQLFNYAVTVYSVGSVSETLRWPIYPFIFILSLGFFSFSLALLTDAVRESKKFLINTGFFRFKSSPESFCMEEKA